MGESFLLHSETVLCYSFEDVIDVDSSFSGPDGVVDEGELLVAVLWFTDEYFVFELIGGFVFDVEVIFSWEEHTDVIL